MRPDRPGADAIIMLLSIPPKLSLSEVVKAIKAKTGLYMRRKFPFLDKVYWGQGGIWPHGYFVPLIGITLFYSGPTFA
jgi:putative transposase